MLKTFTFKTILIGSFIFQIISTYSFAYDLSSLFPNGDPCEMICKYKELRSLSGVRLPKTNMSNGMLDCTDFSKSDLKEVNFEKASLICAILEDAELNGANFSGANILGAKFKGADLDGAYSRFAFFEPNVKIYDERTTKSAFHFVIAEGDAQASVTGLYVIASNLKDAIFSGDTRIAIFKNQPVFESLIQYKNFNFVNGNKIQLRQNKL